MANVRRYRVRAGTKRWGDKGPDLLRPRKNARRALATLLVDRPPRMFVRLGERDWKAIGKRAAVMAEFDSHKGTADFAVGLRKDGKIRPIAEVRSESVALLPLDNCSPATILAWSLLKRQFPPIIFAGAYVWKETKPGEWSDHAWGTAVDGTQNVAQGVSNDETTDWAARMAAAGCISFDYALGSAGGRVVIVDGSGAVAPSGASSSHKWHLHLSVVDHDGNRPPRTGGVW